ncbi:MAG: UbiH/UbiF/VisC/COQ6 family ubiquinone biosynthesis hydroxylase [Alphaproteobacteria bacterium]|nr:UbiH/UbiF/VisC/COQ6 family ubiquinone biosynthesis hydroxylase [Alphaproteobacteria bacterium]
MARERETRVEIAVVGGGLAGVTLALACATAGLEVALIDRLPLKTMLAPKFDGRTTALAHGSKQAMAALGVWDDLAPQAGAILDIRVVDGASPFFLHYDHADIGDEPLGFIVENGLLRRVLYERARAFRNLRYLAPAGVARVADEGATALVEFDDGTRLKAALVAACDGRQSKLRQDAGIKCMTWDYRQTAIVACVAHEKPHRGVAVEHFRPSGPFAILPMTGNRSSIVWSERRARVPELLALPKARFAAELQRRFGDFLGAVTLAGPVWSYPLSFLHAERYTAPRLALVGEAAHAIHPIAGQGLNLSIRDVASLAELAVDARRLGLDIGASDLLARYESWRRFDAVTLAAVTDGLTRLFSNDLRSVGLVRDLGLAAVNRMPRLKQALMRHAMGASGDLPRLVRGERL